jgi:hypothetical protein
VQYWGIPLPLELIGGPVTKLEAKRLLGKKGFIYFLQLKMGRKQPGPIKIGFSKKPNERFRVMHHNLPFDIKVLLVIPSTLLQEKLLHKILRPHRLKGEWYKPTSEILALVGYLISIGHTLGAKAARELPTPPINYIDYRCKI